MSRTVLPPLDIDPKSGLPKCVFCHRPFVRYCRNVRYCSDPCAHSMQLERNRERRRPKAPRGPIWPRINKLPPRQNRLDEDKLNAYWEKVKLTRDEYEQMWAHRSRSAIGSISTDGTR